VYRNAVERMKQLKGRRTCFVLRKAEMKRVCECEWRRQNVFALESAWRQKQGQLEAALSLPSPQRSA